MLTAEQLEARLSGVGGTDAGVILGLSKWKSPYQLWREKRRLVERDGIENDAMEWGNILEPEIAKHYSKRTGRKVRRTKARVHRDYPWMRCNTDRIILGDARGPGILEIKTVNAFAAKSWLGGVPDVYYAQLQHNIAVHGYAWGAFAILIGGQQPVYFDVERDDNFIVEMIKKEGEFWACVQTGVQPAMDGSEATRDALSGQYPKDSGESQFIDDQIETIKALEKAKAAAKVADEEVTRLENTVKAAMGECTVGVITGWGQVVWKKNADSVKEVVDMDRFRRDYPEAFKDVVRQDTRTGARVLRLVPEKAQKAPKKVAVETLRDIVGFRELMGEAVSERSINFDL